MPARPKSICRHPGCGKLIDAPGFCDAHAKQRQRETDSRRGTSTQRGYGHRWQQARRVFLAENPLCLACEKVSRLTPATVVDHIDPHKGDASKFWNRGNWQPLCKPCHDAKTAREDGGFGRDTKANPDNAPTLPGV